MSTVHHKPKNLLPFVISLPDCISKCHEILKPTQSVVMKSGLINLQLGEDVGSHNTGKHEELLIILDGVGEVEIEKLGRQKIYKGCVVYIPPATQHNVYCANTEPLRYLYVVASVE